MFWKWELHLQWPQNFVKCNPFKGILRLETLRTRTSHLHSPLCVCPPSAQEPLHTSVWRTPALAASNLRAFHSLEWYNGASIVCSGFWDRVMLCLNLAILLPLPLSTSCWRLPLNADCWYESQLFLNWSGAANHSPFWGFSFFILK